MNKLNLRNTVCEIQDVTTRKHQERDLSPDMFYSASLVPQMVKNLPAVWETWARSLGGEDPLEEGVVTHSSILAWRMPVDRGAWRATVHVVAKIRATQQLRTHTFCSGEASLMVLVVEI